MEGDERTDGPPTGPAGFRTTHWSLVLQAGRPDSPETAAALETLCQAYYGPIYAYVRRKLHDRDKARDATQEFFYRLLEGNWPARADRDRGRFRNYLLRNLDNFLISEWRASQTQKRGGDKVIVSLDEAIENESFEPTDEQTSTPELLYERRCAERLLDQAIRRLREEYAARGQADRFDALQVYLLGQYDPPSGAETAAALGMTEGAVKSALHALRQRFREIFRAEVLRNVDAPEDVDDEIRHLLSVLG